MMLTGAHQAEADGTALKVAISQLASGMVARKVRALATPPPPPTYRQAHHARSIRPYALAPGMRGGQGGPGGADPLRRAPAGGEGSAGDRLRHGTPPSQPQRLPETI
jgi:hypothetical protein